VEFISVRPKPFKGLGSGNKTQARLKAQASNNAQAMMYKLKMMKKISAYALVIVVFFVSCSTGIRVTNSWKNPKPDTAGKKYHTIFFAVLTDNQYARNTIEENLADAAKTRGYATVTSGTLLTPTFSQNKIPDTNQIMDKVKESKSDAIFTVALVSKEDLSRYVPGEVSNSPSYAWYTTFGGYYGTIAGPIYTPGYYTTDRVYYLQSNLFDAQNEQLLWSARTETYNPSNIEKFSKQFTDAMIKQLERDGILKK
jgi:hypothetical protein